MKRRERVEGREEGKNNKEKEREEEILEKRGKRSAGGKGWEEGERVEGRNIERGRERKGERRYWERRGREKI